MTACLIVENEQEHLCAALASVAFCEEIVVVDGGSSDRTVEIAGAAGARVIENPWPGFAIQRNVALDAATGEWVLEVDADERISPQLRASIEALLSEPPAEVDMAVFALRNRFLGGTLGPAAKYPAYRSRLFRRTSYRHDVAREVHEGLQPRSRPAVLAGDLEHELASTLREALADMWRYARLESMHIPRPHSPLAYVNGILLRPAAKFAYRTVIDGGWRDGWRGLLKISLDVCSDTLVWTLVLLGRGRPASQSDDEARANTHFQAPRVGAVKVVAVARRGTPARAASARLHELRERGADVALVSECPPDERDLPRQAVDHLGPLTLIRALEAERHVRPIDTVFAEGWYARLLVRLLPASFRPQTVDLDRDDLRTR